MNEKNLDLAVKVKTFLANTPTRELREADAILYDSIEETKFEITGIAECVLRTWEKSSDKEAVEEMFYVFTNMQFEDFLNKAIAAITREE